MSHGDHVVKIPNEFEITSKSNNNLISSIENKKNKIFGLQFHPEVFHTKQGKKILYNFLFKITNDKKCQFVHDILLLNVVEKC